MSAPSDRTATRTDVDAPDPEEFPRASLEFGFNPSASDCPADAEFGPDELVVYEALAARGTAAGRWLSAARGSFVGLDETR